jgi:hypothetical protein
MHVHTLAPVSDYRQLRARPVGYANAPSNWSDGMVRAIHGEPEAVVNSNRTCALVRDVRGQHPRPLVKSQTMTLPARATGARGIVVS